MTPQEMIASYQGASRNRWGEAGARGTDFNLYMTRVVRLNPCGNSVVLHTGGHHTASTRRAINDALACVGTRRRVYEYQGEMFVSAGRIRLPGDIPFTEGMTVMLR